MRKQQSSPVTGSAEDHCVGQQLESTATPVLVGSTLQKWRFEISSTVKDTTK